VDWRGLDILTFELFHQSVPLWAAKPLSAERKRLIPPEANFFSK
jgi:hypothetical protein